MAPIIATATLLLVETGLVKVLKVYGNTNSAHPPISQDLVSDGGGNICGKGRRGGRGRPFCCCRINYVG